MIIYNRSILFIFNSLRINGVVECRNNYIRNRDIRGFYVIMGSGISNIKDRSFNRKLLYSLLL